MQLASTSSRPTLQCPSPHILSISHLPRTPPRRTRERTHSDDVLPWCFPGTPARDTRRPCRLGCSTAAPHCPGPLLHLIRRRHLCRRHRCRHLCRHCCCRRRHPVAAADSARSAGVPGCWVAGAAPHRSARSRRRQWAAAAAPATTVATAVAAVAAAARRRNYCWPPPPSRLQQLRKVESIDGVMAESVRRIDGMRYRIDCSGRVTQCIPVLALHLCARAGVENYC